MEFKGVNKHIYRTLETRLRYSEDRKKGGVNTKMEENINSI